VRRAILALAICALVATVIAPMTAAQARDEVVSEYWPEGTPSTPGGAGAQVEELPAGSFAQTCDYPHFSTTAYQQGKYEFAVKCYWTKLSGPATSAKLTVQLQYYNYNTNAWANMGAPTVKTVASNVKVTDAATCSPGTKRTLRGIMDTDIVGYPDPGGWYPGPQITRTCSP